MSKLRPFKDLNSGHEIKNDIDNNAVFVAPNESSLAQHSWLIAVVRNIFGFKNSLLSLISLFMHGISAFCFCLFICFRGFVTVTVFG